MGEALKLVAGLDSDDEVLSCGVGSFENSARLGTEQRLSWLLALAANNAEKELRVLAIGFSDGSQARPFLFYYIDLKFKTIFKTKNNY